MSSVAIGRLVVECIQGDIVQQRDMVLTLAEN
jgi:hypothetical protein